MGHFSFSPHNNSTNQVLSIIFFILQMKTQKDLSKLQDPISVDQGIQFKLPGIQLQLNLDHCSMLLSYYYS